MADMATLLWRLNNFAYEPPESACKSCRSCYKYDSTYGEMVGAAQQRTKEYFNGLCLDCMDVTKSVTLDEHMDYWRHDVLNEEDWMNHCRFKHKQPSWYFSFMGRQDIRDRFLKKRR